MRNLIVAVLTPSLLLLASHTVRADAPSDLLSEDEGLTMCAEALPKELECKQDFCAAMVKIRSKNAKKVDVKAMEAKCLEEIAVDGTGDVATRKGRCSTWVKNKNVPAMTIKRADAKDMDACWAKASCKEKVDCWSPKMAKMMETMPKAK